MVMEVDRLEAEPGAVVTLDQVLLMRDDNGLAVGAPVVAGATVAIEVVEHLRGEKITVFKMKRRKRYRRTQGHRQELTRVKVTAISR
jgi:large subunit ribosomal protein L21